MDFLPDDIIIRVIGYLPITGLLSIYEVSSHLYQISQHDFLWKEFIKRDFPSKWEMYLDNPDRKMTYREAYLSFYDAEGYQIIRSMRDLIKFINRHLGEVSVYEFDINKNVKNILSQGVYRNMDGPLASIDYHGSVLYNG